MCVFVFVFGKEAGWTVRTGCDGLCFCFVSMMSISLWLLLVGQVIGVKAVRGLATAADGHRIDSGTKAIRRRTRLFEILLQNVGIGWFDALIVMLLRFDNLKVELLVELNGTAVVHLNVSATIPEEKMVIWSQSYESFRSI